MSVSIRRLRPSLLAGLAVVSMIAAACGGTTSTSKSTSSNGTSAPSSSASSSTLTLASDTSPYTMNPAMVGNGDPLEFFTIFTYDSLTHLNANGTFSPDLATSWGYVGSGNLKFRLTIRSNARFSDGTAVTPAAVKDTLEFYAKSAYYSSRFDFKSIAVTGSHSLLLTLLKPDPILPYYFDQDTATGNIISPRLLANAKALGTTTDGSGPYELDTAATVVGSKYVFTPNPYYWDKSAVHWKKVVLEVITDPTAMLEAMKSGQVMAGMGQSSTASAAKSAGLVVSSAPSSWNSVVLMDRSGKTTKALGNQLVREALNYAIDRPVLAKTLVGTYGGADDETAVPGSVGYDAANANQYPYDPTKAKQLLAEAGYAHGFTLPLLAYDLEPGETTLAQAAASEWSNIGINVQVETPANYTAYNNDLASLKYSSQVFSFSSHTIWQASQELMIKGAGFLNPYNSDSPALDTLITEAGAASTASTQTTTSDALETAVMTKAWFVPVDYSDVIWYTSKSLKGFDLTSAEPDPDPLSWAP